MPDPPKPGLALPKASQPPQPCLCCCCWTQKVLGWAGRFGLSTKFPLDALIPCLWWQCPPSLVLLLVGKYRPNVDLTGRIWGGDRHLKGTPAASVCVPKGMKLWEGWMPWAQQLSTQLELNREGRLQHVLDCVSHWEKPTEVFLSG